jgi:hypothetical protein
MNTQDIAHIVQGLVEYRDRWIPIEKKAAIIQRWQKRVEEGYVLYNGEWITIEEKIARLQAQTVPPAQAAQPQQQPQNITINKTVNRQVYNISSTTDNRTVNQHNEEHKHVHLDEQTMADSIKKRILGSSSPGGMMSGESPEEIDEIRRNLLEQPHRRSLRDPGPTRPLPPPPE